jgi:hypothetical protein
MDKRRLVPEVELAQNNRFGPYILDLLEFFRHSPADRKYKAHNRTQIKITMRNSVRQHIGTVRSDICA